MLSFDCIMTITVKSRLASLVVPASVRRQAGIRAGDRLEFRARPGVITIVSRPAETKDVLTPGQSRIIDKQLAEGLDDVKKRRVSRRFDSVDEMLAAMKSGMNRPASTRRR